MNKWLENRYPAIVPKIAALPPRTVATAFTTMVVASGLSFLSWSPECFELALIFSTVLVGRAMILRGSDDRERPAWADAASPMTARASTPMLALPSPDERLRVLRDRIRRSIDERGLAPVMGEQLGDLDRLVQAFGRLGEELAIYRTHVKEHSLANVEAEVMQLEHKIAAAHDAAKPLLVHNQEVLRMRLDKLRSIQTSAEIVEAQRGVIEDTVKLIYDQVLAAASHDDLREALARVAAGIRTTDEILADTRGLLLHNSAWAEPRRAGL